MLHLLQRHALSITAELRASLVLAYAVPKQALQPLLSPGLTLDTYGDFGFLAIALVETRNLRPSFLPAQLGVNFFLSGYRVFTRYHTHAGKSLRGLRILRSDTNRRAMQVFEICSHTTATNGPSAMCSAERLPYEDVSFDAVFDFRILHHVPVWQAAVAEVRRVLRSNGRFFFEEVTRRALKRWLYRTMLEQPTENRFDEAEFMEEIRSHGFELMNTTHRVLFGDVFIGAAALSGP